MKPNRGPKTSEWPTSRHDELKDWKCSTLALVFPWCPVARTVSFLHQTDAAEILRINIVLKHQKINSSRKPQPTCAELLNHFGLKDLGRHGKPRIRNHHGNAGCMPETENHLQVMRHRVTNIAAVEKGQPFRNLACQQTAKTR